MDGVFAKWKYINSYDYVFNPVLFVISVEGNHFGSRESMPVSQQKRQISKEIGADISIFSGFSALYWHIVKQSFIFVTASIITIINLRFFVWVFCKTLIVNYVSFPYAVMVQYVWLAGYIRNVLFMLPEMHTLFFSPTPPIHLASTTNDQYLASALLYKHGASEARQD